MDELVTRMLREVERFSHEVLGLKIPDEPTALEPERFTFAMTALQEELDEFREAYESGDFSGQTDALIDLVYFALGRLLEMGIPPGPAFAEVQEANMRKKRGQTKRGHEIDAAKPVGWAGPDYRWLIHLTRQECEVLRNRPPEHEQPILTWNSYINHKHNVLPFQEPLVLDKPITQVEPRAEKRDPLSKPQTALIPYEAIKVEAEGMAYGAYVKYKKWDWIKGRYFSELVSSCHHHIAAWFDREVIDPESKVHHLGLARCNLAMMIALEKMGRTDLDDRRPAESVTEHKPGGG
jgi:predicted HAD superfamily Cof-like phosphohydrolase